MVLAVAVLLARLGSSDPLAPTEASAVSVECPFPFTWTTTVKVTEALGAKVAVDHPSRPGNCSDG